MINTTKITRAIELLELAQRTTDRATALRSQELALRVLKEELRFGEQLKAWKYDF